MFGVTTRAERISAAEDGIVELEALKQKLEARPDEPAFKEGEKPPVVMWRYVDGEQQFAGVAIRAGDLWFVATTDPYLRPEPMPWDDLLDWADGVQLSDVTFPSW